MKNADILFFIFICILDNIGLTRNIYIFILAKKEDIHILSSASDEAE